MTPGRLIQFKAANGHWVATEQLSNPRALHANRENNGPWETYRVYLLDGIWDVGKRVLLETSEKGWFVSYSVTAQNQGRPVMALLNTGTVFIVERGESVGTWALRATSGVITVDVPGTDSPLYIQTLPVHSWESFHVYDAETGKELSDPFEEGGGSGWPQPSPEQLLDVCSNICNYMEEMTSQHYLMLSGFAFSLDDAARRANWYRAQVNGGAKSTAVGVKYFYHDFSDRGVLPQGKDWINELDRWIERWWEAQSFFPNGLQTFLTQGDGNWDDPNSETRQFCDPSSPTYGPRLVDNIRNASLHGGFPDPIDYGSWCVGWEPDPRGVTTFIPVLRRAVGHGKVLLHLQQGYGNPTGEGSDFWASEVGQMIDQMLFQAIAFSPTEFDEFGQPAWQDNAIEILNRVLPTGTPLPGCKGHKWRDRESGKVMEHPGWALGPDWFAHAAARKPFSFYECSNYWFSHYIYGLPHSFSVPSFSARFLHLGFNRMGLVRVADKFKPLPVDAKVKLASVDDYDWAVRQWLMVAGQAKTLGYKTFGSGVPA
jgi:hypothetical protein